MGVTGDEAIQAGSGRPGSGMGVVMSPVLVSTYRNNRNFTLSPTEWAVTTSNQERVSDYCLNLRGDLYSSETNLLSQEVWRARDVKYPYPKGHIFVAAVEINQTSSFAASHHQFPYMPLPAQEGWQQLEASFKPSGCREKP